MTRELPRPFRMPWGKGQIVEEVSIPCPHWEPTVQLMEYEDGERSLRFCYYSEGRFGRGPMILAEDDLDRMAEALPHAPMIEGMLRRMAGVG